MTGASPPVLRAFISWCLGHFSKRERWNWTRAQTLTVSGFATIPFCKDQWGLCSLGLGWIAALALGFSTNKIDKQKEVLSHASFKEKALRWRSRVWHLCRMNFCVYVAVIPALMPLGVPSSFSIFANLIFAPVMGLILFPVSLAAFMWEGFVRLADGAWTASLWLVSSAAQITPDAWEKVNLSPLWLTPYIFLLTAWFMQRDRRSKHLTKFLLVAICALSIGVHAHADELIVWNIGQGAWATLKSEGLCQHFDMGGEWMPRKKIIDACRASRNEVFFSHWDWDHIGLTRTAIQVLPNLCVQAVPGGPPPNKFKSGLIQSIPRCKDSPRATEIFLSKISEAELSHLHDANDFSQVFVEDDVIFPGDSPKREEKRWRQSPLLKQARILIAGHHGSKSATSEELLAKLPKLKMIIASAHKIRYGHPHPFMLARAQKYLLPVLRTEEWGSLHFELNKLGKAPRHHLTAKRRDWRQIMDERNFE
jgi:competence protein ComEC